MKLGLESESYHLHFQNNRMDIFDFINKTAELGMDGVQINIVKDYNLDPDWGALGSNDPAHLKKIKELIQKHNLYAEIDMRGVDSEKIAQVVEVAHIIGADIIRTYIVPRFISHAESADVEKYDPIKLKHPFDPKVYTEAVEELKKSIPLLEKYNIKLALENHECEISSEVIAVIKELNTPWIGAHFDFGNSMMAWEEPITAVKNMAPYVYTTHFKDHIIIEDPSDEFGYKVCGVPAGEGNVDLESIYKVLLEKSTLTRINLEMCYPYATSFKRDIGTGGVTKLGTGAFKVEPQIYNYDEIKPEEYYYPQLISEKLLEKLLIDQEEGVKRSIMYLKKLRDKFVK